MKKFSSFLVGIILISQMALVSSCKKENNHSQAGNYVPTINYFPQISTYTDSADSYTITFIYDTEGKLVKEIYSDGYISNIQYSTEQVTVCIIDTNNIIYEKIIYLLNSSGMATTQIIYIYDDKKNIIHKRFPFNNKLDFKSVSIDTFKYEYDLNGFLTKSIYLDYGDNDTITYHYNSGNMTYKISFKYQDTLFYEYYTDKLNTIGYQNLGINFLGKQNINLEKNIIQNDYGTLFIDTYTYLFDLKKRAIKVQYWSDDFLNSTAFYTYVE